METPEFLLEGARIIDPVRGIDSVGDVAIRDGHFVTPELLHSPKRINLAGKVLCPGFIDLHVHLRDPGQTHKEDIASGTRAAAAGGFTTVLAMPNTVPAIDTPEAVRDVMDRAAGCPAHVLQAGALTYGREGIDPTSLQELKEAGAPAFSDDGSTTQSAGIMRHAMLWAAALNIPVIDHCEDTSLSKPGLMHEGAVSRELHLPGQPRSAEELIVARDIMLAKETGCHVHLQHLSSAGSVEMLRNARKQGLPVTGEVTPHHLFLTDEACRTFGTNAKMAPPLREESDRQALIDALRDGTITAIATDHAPHTAAEKANGWFKAPFGIVGIEAVVPLCLTELYHTGILSLSNLVALFTKGPREILHLQIGSLSFGAPADLTVLDLDARHILQVANFKSQGKNCPYDGWKCHGAVHSTFLNGIEQII